MKQYRHHAGGVAVALTVFLWASAAAAAPGKLCSVTRAWVERHCDKAGRLATPERCTKWRGWLDDRCPTEKPSASDTGTDRSKVGDDRADRSKAAVPVDRSNAGDGRAKRSETALSAGREKRGGLLRQNVSLAARPVCRPSVPEARPVTTRTTWLRGTMRRGIASARIKSARASSMSSSNGHRAAAAPRSPVLYYRTTPYRDQVFVTDHVLRRGKEAAFFRSYEAARQ